MNRLLKMAAVIAFAITMSACGHMGAITGGAVGAHYGGVGGAAVGAGIGSVIDEQGRVHHGRVVGQQNRSSSSCALDDAAVAEAEMWATALDNPHQQRRVQASKSNGRANCSSSLVAGSGTGVDPRRHNNGVIQYVPARSSQQYRRPDSQIYNMD